MNRGNQQPDDTDDPAVQAEWRRLEAARLAEERAEAREDAEEAAHEPAISRSDRRWQPLGFAVALAAGIVTAFLVNRPRSGAIDGESKARAVKDAMQAWNETGAGDTGGGDGPRIARVVSTAALPGSRLRIRVGLRDERSRERLESLLAASGLRIEGDLETAVEEAAAAAGAVAAERLVVSGRPAAVDALLDALAASAGVMSLAGEGIFAAAPAEPAGAPAEAEAEPPTRVRLVIEIAEAVAEPGA